MSDMDGFTATTRIREREAGGTRIPIVALTAHDARSYRERVLKAGMDDILSKPYSLDDCRAMLMRWIGGNAVAADEVDAAPRAEMPVDSRAPSASAADDTAALACIDAGAVQSLGPPRHRWTTGLVQPPRRAVRIFLAAGDGAARCRAEG